MNLSEFTFKTKNKLWFKLVQFTRYTKIYPFIYRSYWHYLFHKRNTLPNITCYYSAQPNLGAGIGHQMGNWIAGFWYARQFGLKFAHLSFSNKKWEEFLGLGISEVTVRELKSKKYKIRNLPQFESDNLTEMNLNRFIIQSYFGEKVVFIAEQDQYYKNQYGIIDELKTKFRSAPVRKNDTLKYDKSKFNIAVHVRRTVIIDGKTIMEDDAAKSMRWLSNDYYERVLVQVLENIKVDKPIAVWLFSTGKAEEFADFAKYGEIHFCNNMDEYQSFAHLVFADMLITSKSSFSYKPALMNDGIKICPRNFWHGYPDTKDWILVENDGSFDVSLLDDGQRTADNRKKTADNGQQTTEKE